MRKKSKNKALPSQRETAADIAHGPEPIPGVSEEVELEVAQLAKPVIRYTLEETKRQELYVQDLLINGADYRTITRLCRGQWPKFTARRTEVLVRRVRGWWKDERKDVPEARDEAIKRIHRMRQWALGEQGPDGKWKTKPDLKALARFEALLMKIQGTEHQPAKIEVHQTFNQAMAQTIVEMSPEMAEQLLAEARETEKLAQMARELLPALPASTGG